jgi:hypothetical protein
MQSALLTRTNAHPDAKSVRALMFLVILLAGTPGVVFGAMLAANFYNLRGADGEIGLRAVVIVLAPLLVSALSVIAVWAATHHWVLRWFARMQAAARNFASGDYVPPAMAGAPTEIATLADAFDDAVNQARTREHDLAEALISNVALTRELHHRVQNNIQILTSMVSRQQRRTNDPTVRRMLCEVRARMIPVALAHRFVAPPALHSSIDTNAYLAELANQLHTALEGDARCIKLDVAISARQHPVDTATNIGLIVAEAFIAGYARAAEAAPSRALLSYVVAPDGSARLSAGVPDGRAADDVLIRQLARQVNGEVAIAEDGLVQVAIPPATAQAQEAA